MSHTQWDWICSEELTSILTCRHTREGIDPIHTYSTYIHTTHTHTHTQPHSLHPFFRRGTPCRGNDYLLEAIPIQLLPHPQSHRWICLIEMARKVGFVGIIPTEMVYCLPNPYIRLIYVSMLVYAAYAVTFTPRLIQMRRRRRRILLSPTVVIRIIILVTIIVDEILLYGVTLLPPILPTLSM